MQKEVTMQPNCVKISATYLVTFCLCIDGYVFLTKHGEIMQLPTIIPEQIARVIQCDGLKP
jgi:hypothetical protein